MSELHNARTMLDKAEDAARAGDFTSADRLLRDIARIQEAELGPQHPELANTLNNLAIVAERGGRPDDAESFYRRSAAIASASLPADHPMVVTSRQNLDAFHRARQSSMETPSMKVSSKDADLGLEVFAREGAANQGEKEPEPFDFAQGESLAAAPPFDSAQGKPQAAPAPVEPARDPNGRSAASGSHPWLAIGVVALVIAGVLATRAWTSRDGSEPPSTATRSVAEEAPAAPANVEPASPPPSPPPPAVPQPEGREAVADQPAPAPSPAGAITVAMAQLCRSLSTGSWRCDPAGDVVTPGPIAYYTRVRSPRGGTVVHRWYRGDTLRTTVPLTVRANPGEGFRTYSRQTVDAGEWRVEARVQGGDLLHEQRFTVR